MQEINQTGWWRRIKNPKNRAFIKYRVQKNS